MSIFGVTSTSTRVNGMMSGIDTDDVVKTMTMGTANKIAKVQQQIQLLEWKAQSYQGISSKMINFNNTYLSYSSSMNALTSGFYNTRSVSSSSGAVSVSGYSASAANLSIQDIKSHAVTSSFVSKKEATKTSISIEGIDFSSTGKLVNNVAGETITMSYGGTTYRVKIDDNFVGISNADVTQAINDALAEVEITGGGSLADKIKVFNMGGGMEMRLLELDDTNTVKITGGSGTILTAIGIDVDDNNTAKDGDPLEFGVVAGKMESYNVFNETIAAEDISFTLNGITKSVYMPRYDNQADFQTELQREFDIAFGANRVEVVVSGNKITLQTVKPKGDGTNIEDPTSVLTISGASSALSGFKSCMDVEVGTSNRLVATQAIGDANWAGTGLLGDGVDGDEFDILINGVPLSFTADQTLQEILSQINNSAAGVKVEYLSTTNTFSVTSTRSGASGSIQIQDVNGNLAATMFGTGITDTDFDALSPAANPDDYDYIITTGKDAVIDISYDGGLTTSTITRDSNTFELDGLTLTLNPNAKIDPADGFPITFAVNTNADALVDKIMTMVEAFNEINDLVNSEMNTRYDREYPPLTAEQRADMTESEIALWEEKAKAGLLFADPTLRSLATELRFVFSFSVPGVGAISDFGITVSKAYADFGKVLVDEDALRAAIEQRPDDIAELFTAAKSGSNASDQGIMLRVKDVFDRYAATTGSTKGTLITIAGVEGGSVLIQDTQISKQIDGLKEQLERLQYSLKMSTDRYYKQFTALEVYLANMSAQSSWLMEYFS